MVNDEIELWRCCLLEEVYEIRYVDGIRVKIKDNGVVGTKVAYLVIGVDRRAVSMPRGAGSATAKAPNLAESRDRSPESGCQRRPEPGDGLTGLPDATAVPRHRVQTCVVHVIRNVAGAAWPPSPVLR